MNYQSVKVRDAMRQISQNEIYLPAIQRKFVWDQERIEKLFDSIMRGYPIGTFLFWFVEGKAKDDYTFYKFIQDFHERDNAVNQVAPEPDLRDAFIGVLDGQQRLNSMYVALQGSYAAKRRHGRWNDDKAFPRKMLYLNLLFKPTAESDNGIEYEFSFLTPEHAKVVDESHYWFLVKDTLVWDAISPVFGVISEAAAVNPLIGTALSATAAPVLSLLWQRLCADDVINYFKIAEQDLDRIVDIFVRVNSSGVQLSKTDLLFSTIVAHWDEGRSNIEAALKTLNAKGNRFEFDNDFMMRSCLVLTDLPVLFKAKSFRKESIEEIERNWDSIKAALEKTVDLLVAWGFSVETLPTLNAVIPIAYFAYKGGDLAASNAALRQYLTRALINQIFASQTDRVLAAIRDHLRVQPVGGTHYELRTKRLDVTDIVEIKLPGERSLAMTDEDIDELLDAQKGPYTSMLLALLYPHLRYEQIVFHQDHLHPWSQFSRKKLENIGISDGEIRKWQEDRDRLPNLQLLESSENQSKNDSPLEVWMNTLGASRAHYEQSNYIPVGVDLSLAEFPTFFNARRDILRAKLRQAFSG
jgi:uncharacterized protein with ParB-like and HNH nuclease domain